MKLSAIICYSLEIFVISNECEKSPCAGAGSAAERKKRLSQTAAVRFLALLGGLPITVEQETPERMLKEIVSLAREHGLSTYDASYLDLAMRLDLPLATFNSSLTKAAKKSKVPAFEPFHAR